MKQSTASVDTYRSNGSLEKQNKNNLTAKKRIKQELKKNWVKSTFI